MESGTCTPVCHHHPAIDHYLPNVQHWVLWSRKGLSDDEVIAEIEKRFPGRNYCFFESKDKSVPEVNHAQVFIEF